MRGEEGRLRERTTREAPPPRAFPSHTHLPDRQPRKSRAEELNLMHSSPCPCRRRNGRHQKASSSVGGRQVAWVTRVEPRRSPRLGSTPPYRENLKQQGEVVTSPSRSNQGTKGEAGPIATEVFVILVLPCFTSRGFRERTTKSRPWDFTAHDVGATIPALGTS